MSFRNQRRIKRKHGLKSSLPGTSPNMRGGLIKKETAEAGEEMSRMSVAEGQAPCNVRKEGD